MYESDGDRRRDAARGTPSLRTLAGGASLRVQSRMAIDAAAVKTLVERELAPLADARVLRPIRRLLVEPYEGGFGPRRLYPDHTIDCRGR